MNLDHVSSFLVTKPECLITVVTLMATILVKLLVILELHFSPEPSPAVPLTAEMRIGDVGSTVSPHASTMNCFESTDQTFELLWSYTAKLFVS